MTTRTSRGTKRFVATAAAAAVIASTLAISGSAAAGPGAAAPTSERLSGPDRYGTAVDVADELPDYSTITIANGQRYPDGLTGAFLDNAILLTELNSIPAPTKTFLDAKNGAINNIDIVGGLDVVSAAVATQLAAYGTVRRLSGETRYTTATAVAEAQAPAATTIIVARGDEFPDALASGPLAIVADAPIILNVGPTLRSEVTAYLNANPQITDVYIVGGETVVPASVAAELRARGKTVERLGGSDRDETAVAVANELRTFRGFNDGVILANRLRFADAMVAGPLGAHRTSPILLVAEDSIPAATAAYHVANCLTIAQIVAVGGTAVIKDSVIAGAVAAATCGTRSPNQTFTAAPELVTVSSLTADVVVYTFDEAIPGQALDPVDFRLYNVAGGYSNPTALSISGSTVLARFPATGITFAQASLATVRYGAVADATGLVNPAAGVALQTTAGPAVSAYKPALVQVRNWAQGPIIVGDDASVRVDFVFDSATATATYGLDAADGPKFNIVGAQNGLFTGDTIVSIVPNASAGTTTVTVQFSTAPSELPESQLRRGYFVNDDAAPLTNDLTLSSNFGTTGGITVNPDLVSIVRVDADTFRFEFDEAVSALDAQIDDAGFFVFNEAGAIVQSTSAARSALGADEARFVVVDFTGLAASAVQVGGYVRQGAVVATDSTTFNGGQNRADQKTLTLPPAPGAPPAGTVNLPKLNLIVRATDLVSGDLNAVFVFDRAITQTQINQLRFGLYDANGIRFEGGAAFLRNTVAPGSDSSNTQVIVLFENDDQIAAAVTGDVQTRNATVDADLNPATPEVPVAAVSPEAQKSIVAIQN